MKKAIVHFADGTRSVVIVNLSYSKGGTHFYNLTLNALSSFIEYKPGETKLYSDKEVSKLTYIMA